MTDVGHDEPRFDKTTAPTDGPRPDGPTPRAGALAGSDYLIALLVGALPFAVYVVTMYPGLSDIGDGTKFAFVGKVLGTPHAPGYPLYVVLSHLFSYVPWGTLVYRMNGFSALLGGCAVALNYLLMRRLEVGRMAATAAALALGFGDAFWSRAQYPKYYTLNATLITWGIFALLRWGQTLRQRDLYIAVAIFALASGNHLTIVGLLPALVLFTLLTSPRSVLRPSALAAITGIVLLGLSQYLFIWLRTVQGAPYLEARATSLRQVWAIMTARRFAHEIGAYSPDALWSSRVPLIWGLVEKEFGWLGICLVAAGAIVLFARRPRQALLLTLGGLGIALLTVNMASQEDQGFMVGCFVLLWPLGGVALDWLWSMRAGRLATLASRVAAAALAVALPCSLVAVNFGPNDRRTDTAEEDYIDALIAALPDRAAVVTDEYRVNMMFTYKFLGEGVNARRGIGMVRPEVESLRVSRAAGREVFALPTGRRQVLQYGARFEPFEFRYPPSADQIYHQRPVFRLLSVPTCLDIGKKGWLDISPTLQPFGRLSVRIDNYRPFDSEVVVWAATAAAGPVHLVGVSGRGTPVLEQAAFRRANPAEAMALAARLTADGVHLPDAMTQAPRLVRAQVRVNDRGDFSNFGIDFGGPVASAMGRAEVDLKNRKRGVVCTHEFSDVDAWPDASKPLDLTPLSAAVGFGAGWYDVERDANGRSFRWTGGRASVIVPLIDPRAATLTIEGEIFNYPNRRTGTITLVVNGATIGTQPTPDGPSLYSWLVPVDAWRSGLNEVTLIVGGATSPKAVGLGTDGRVLGVLVTHISLEAPTPK